MFDSGSSPITIAALKPQHIVPCRSLWQETEGIGLSEADEPQRLAAFLDRNPGLSFVAMADDEIVGTVLCGHDGRRGLIHHLAVASSHRRRGLGRLLLRAGLGALLSAGIQKAHLLVLTSNADGLAFWRSVGAEERKSMALFSMETKVASSDGSA